MEETFYPIGEVSRLSGVPVKTIRYYSDVDLLPPARTTTARYRLYTMEDIWRLQLIRVLRKVGFGLGTIRALLARDLPVATAIDWQLEALEGQMRQLGRVRAILQSARQETQDTEESLQHLRDLSLALGEDGAECSRFLSERLRMLVMKANLPDQWREQLLLHFNWRFRPSSRLNR